MARNISRALFCALLAASTPAIAQQQVNEVRVANFVVKDMRNVGPSSVRFIAAQGTEDLPNLLLVGGSKEIWPKVREAVLESEAMGYPVRAILVGPQGESPALEIYAKGWKVTNPINPNEINQNILVQLIQNVHHEYYEAH